MSTLKIVVLVLITFMCGCAAPVDPTPVVTGPAWVCTYYADPFNYGETPMMYCTNAPSTCAVASPAGTYNDTAGVTQYCQLEDAPAQYASPRDLPLDVPGYRSG